MNTQFHVMTCPTAQRTAQQWIWSIHEYPNIRIPWQIERMRHEREKERQQRLKQAQSCRILQACWRHFFPSDSKILNIPSQSPRTVTAKVPARTISNRHRLASFISIYIHFRSGYPLESDLK